MCQFSAYSNSCTIVRWQVCCCEASLSESTCSVPLSFPTQDPNLNIAVNV